MLEEVEEVDCEVEDDVLEVLMLWLVLEVEIL